MKERAGSYRDGHRVVCGDHTQAHIDVLTSLFARKSRKQLIFKLTHESEGRVQSYGRLPFQEGSG